MSRRCAAPRRRRRVSDEDRARFRIGAEGNPVYREIFRRPDDVRRRRDARGRLTAAGGIVHCPGGGTHHGRPDRAPRASATSTTRCWGCSTWLDLGLDNIVYLDIDAHHGDGVQDAFHDDDRVLTISMHEAGRWPFTGAADDRAGGAARNFPVPAGCNDSEMRVVMQQRGAAADRARRPAGDHAAVRGRRAARKTRSRRLSLSNNAHLAVVAALRDAGAALVVTRRRRLQPLDGRALLGRRSGRRSTASRSPTAPPPAAEAVLRGARLQPRRRPQPAGALVHHPARRPARRAGAPGDHADRADRGGCSRMTTVRHLPAACWRPSLPRPAIAARPRPDRAAAGAAEGEARHRHP